MRYIIKETQYKRLIELMVEQETSTTPATTGLESGTVKAAGYGDISRVPGSELEQTASALKANASGQSVIVYKDKELRTREGGYILKDVTAQGGKVTVDFGNWTATADCSKLPAENGFVSGTRTVYSTELANMGAEACKAQK
jgi:hypothetical protein